MPGPAIVPCCTTVPSSSSSEYLKDKGVALGMVRNKTYSSFIQSNKFQYKPGDIMVLYTDGVTEAKDGKGEEFGYERLANLVNEAKEWRRRRFKIT